MNMFEKFSHSVPVCMRDPEYAEVLQEMERSGAIVDEINKNWLKMRADGSLYEKEAELLQKPLGQNASFLPPFTIDIGRQVSIGDNAFVNHSFTASAAGGISIGEGVMIAPNVSILTVNHDVRDKWILICKPVTLKKNAWIGANVTICPGVTIGENSVVGSGSVVTKDIPDNCMAVGNPARVIKTIDMETGETVSVPKQPDKLLAALEKRVQELEDREAIRAVLDAFSNTADTKDMHAQGLLFTEDAKVNQHFGGAVNVLSGRDGIIAAFGDYLATVARTYHFNGQQTIRFVDETHAEVLSYCSVVQILERDGKPYMLNGGAHYVDQFVKRDGKWQIAVRDQYSDYADQKELAAMPV